jgi:kynurenine formamidase
VRRNDRLDPLRTEGTDQLVLEISVADEEAQRLQVRPRQIRADAGAFERPRVAPFLTRVAETRDADVARPLQKSPERLRPADRHDRDALGIEVTTATCGERLERDAVADPLDENDGFRVHEPYAHTPVELTYSRVVDLTHVIDPSIPSWPGDPPVVFETVATFEQDGYYLRSVTIGEHSGTHMNAPNSFIAGDANSVMSYSVEHRVVPAVVVDVRDEAGWNPDYQLTTQDVVAWEDEYGEIGAGSLVILFTGWQDRWSDPNAFINEDNQGNLHFPGFAAETTRWLLSDREISGVGTDTHGVDPGLDTSHETNSQIARAHKIAIECMANLDQLPPTGATLVLGPLQLRDGSGSPVSVVAFVP